MERTLVVVSIVLSACGGGDDSGPDAPTDQDAAPPRDAMVHDSASIDGSAGDAIPDGAAPDAVCGGASLPFELTNLDRCSLPVSLGNFMFPAASTVTVDTTAGTVSVEGLATGILAQIGGAHEAMVIVADDLTVPADTIVDVSGERPLVVIALGDLVIAGVLDGSADGSERGPGGDLSCATGQGHQGAMQDDANSHSGFSGGGGGGYGTAGGTGAPVAPPPTSPAPTPGGSTWGSAPLVPLVGGCRGGYGGSGGLAAAHGGAGGALQLVAGGQLQVTATGVVSVSGGGGRPATSAAAGGGGGGSGGSVLLQAAGVTVMGAVTANGGGGGAGRRDGATGTAGEDGSLVASIPAAGGTSVTGGEGGTGGVLAEAGGDGALGVGSLTFAAGGGGGGGGVGRIQIAATTIDLTGAVCSPQPTI